MKSTVTDTTNILGKPNFIEILREFELEEAQKHFPDDTDRIAQINAECDELVQMDQRLSQKQPGPSTNIPCDCGGSCSYCDPTEYL